MIIARDIMNQLEFEISFKNKVISWEGMDIPMRDFNRIKKWNLSKFKLKAIIQEMNEPITTQEATDRMLQILDSKYNKANLKHVIEGAKHLNQKEKNLLSQLL